MFPSHISQWLHSRLQQLIPNDYQSSLEYLEKTLADQSRSDSLFDQCASHLQGAINNPGQISDLLNELFAKIDDQRASTNPKLSPDIVSTSYRKRFRYSDDSDSEEDDFDERPRRRSRLLERERNRNDESSSDMDRFNAEVDSSSRRFPLSSESNDHNERFSNATGRIASHVTNSGNNRFVENSHFQPEQRPRELVSIGTNADFRARGPRPKYSQGFENTRPNQPAFRRNNNNNSNNNNNNNSNFAQASQRQRNSARLVLKNVPTNLNNEADIRSHFETFGEIVTCTPCLNNDPQAALLVFSEYDSAVAAYRSPAAILGNRFIRIFWENPKYNRNGNENQKNGNHTMNNADSTNACPEKPALQNGGGGGGDTRKRKTSEPFKEYSSGKQYSVQNSGENHRPPAGTVPAQATEETVTVPVKAIPLQRVLKLNQELNLIKQHQVENIQNQKLLLEKLERADNETTRSGIAKLLDIQIKKGKDLKEQIETIESTLASGQPNKYIAPANHDNNRNGNVPAQLAGLEVYDD